MTIALWITAILLTIVYLMAGAVKTLTPKEKLQPKMAYVEDFSAGQVKAIGIIEFIGALGVILPLVTGIAPVLTAVAAICLVVVQIVAATVHIRRKEMNITPNIVLALLAAAVAVLYFLAV